MEDLPAHFGSRFLKGRGFQPRHKAPTFYSGFSRRGSNLKLDFTFLAA